MASTPYDSLKQPDNLLSEGVRLEGRGYEQFRNICAPCLIMCSAAGCIAALYRSQGLMCAGLCWCQVL